MPAYFSKIDLHSHSTASDGAFTPTALVERAIERGLTHLALTDHDAVLGVKEAQEAARGRLELIPGAELSATWENKQIHIAALFLDIESPILKEFLDNQKTLRVQRAMEIGAKLDKQGFKNSYEECVKRAGEGASITRGNYARYIFEMGRAQSADDAFNSYLKKGKSCYVKTNWPDVKDVVKVILQSGGVPVLAHPKRYILTNTKLRALMEYFKDAGGVGSEVSSSQMRPCDRDYLATLCQKYDFYASLGSDFHAVGPFRELGLNLLMPENLKHVWDLPQAQNYHFEQYLEKFIKSFD